jgi:hypothetical protein
MHPPAPSNIGRRAAVAITVTLVAIAVTTATAFAAAEKEPVRRKVTDRPHR